MAQTESYRRATCCPNTDCAYMTFSHEPCWGQVEVVGEGGSEDDWFWIHACEGHADIDSGGKYIHESINPVQKE